MQGSDMCALQALNNWGLVLQELASMGAPAEQAGLVRQSVRKFRRAVRMRPDFDRACYNLGTVFYALACTQQASLTQQLPSRVTQVRPCKPRVTLPDRVKKAC